MPRSGFVAPDRAAVANDDRQNVGVMLQALQVRPSRRAYVFAALVSLLWLGGVGALVYSQGIDDAGAAARRPSRPRSWPSAVSC